MIDLVIGGDVCPIGRNESLFKSGDAEAIFNNLLPELKKLIFLLSILNAH